MKLKNLKISNFQCFDEKPTIINFEEDISVFIGLNGSGKTSTLHALSRLFGVNETTRKVRVEDFHCISNDISSRSEHLFIEAWFNFPELTADATEKNLTAVASAFNQLCFTDPDGSLLLRIRLEAKLTIDDLSPEGVVSDSVYYIISDQDEYRENQKKELRRSDRNRIQVHYIPASRNPAKEISTSTKVLIGRLMNAINWDKKEDGELTEALNFTKLASDKLVSNEAIKLIETQLQINWSKMYSGDFLSKAKIHFLPLQIEELLKTVSLSFISSKNSLPVTIDKLSDGQRSLLHIAIIQAVHELESSILRQSENIIHFDQSRLKQPIFTLLALEEPENHLAPHFLGRIIKSMVSLANTKDAQVVVTTHAPSLVGRVKPEKLRYFRIDPLERSTSVRKIPLPEKKDELYKFVSGAVKAYPEIYFARLVVLGEGESEQIILPKLLDELGVDVDDSFITVAPLGGRHVNHFWKLLSGLGIPYVTLLDLDYCRYGGGWGRIKYVCDQLSLYKKVKPIISPIPEWNNTKLNPITFHFDNEKKLTALELLQDYNVFFSSPLDIDYAMQKSFPEHYNIALDSENGPQDKEWDDLKKSVLKKEYSDELSSYYVEEDNKNDFLWYNYRFLSKKGKPTSHINALESIDFSVKDNRDKISKSLLDLISKIQEIILELQE